VHALVDRSVHSPRWLASRKVWPPLGLALDPKLQDPPPATNLPHSPSVPLAHKRHSPHHWCCIGHTGLGQQLMEAPQQPEQHLQQAVGAGTKDRWATWM